MMSKALEGQPRGFFLRDLKNGLRKWIKDYRLCRRNGWRYGAECYYKAIMSEAIVYSKAEKKRLRRMMGL
ncbi:MAG: hypothetical protein V1784_07355 [bacterium]